MCSVGSGSQKYRVEWSTDRRFLHTTSEILSQASCSDDGCDWMAVFPGTSSIGVQFTVGGGLLQHNLLDGVSYYIRVAAYADSGPAGSWWSSAVLATPVTIAPEAQLPPAPALVTVARSLTEVPSFLDVTYEQPNVDSSGFPTIDGGSTIQSYEISVFEPQTADSSQSAPSSTPAAPQGEPIYTLTEPVVSSGGCPAHNRCNSTIGAEV